MYVYLLRNKYENIKFVYDGFLLKKIFEKIEHLL